MNKPKGQSVGNVVELSKARGEEAGKAVTDFVRDHPLLVVAGGVALGAVLAAFLPRGTGRAFAKRAASLAEVASAAGVLIGSRAKETAEATGAGLRERGSAAAERLEKFGDVASDRLSKIGSAASAQVESAAAKVAEKAAELRSRARH